ncbi:MAG: hypothetical protein JW751_29520 [Polyangiaceae bacterium]|nr:hypothetical protein [Polyangiaceae bacterium]
MISDHSRPSVFPPREDSLTVVLKSDREKLSGRNLVEAAVCLANAECGALDLGAPPGGVAP